MSCKGCQERAAAQQPQITVKVLRPARTATAYMLGLALGFVVGRSWSPAP